MWEDCQQDNATHDSESCHNLGCTGQIFSSFFNQQYNFKDETTPVFGERVMVTHRNAPQRMKYPAQSMKYFITQQHSIRENRQRKAAVAVNYLCQLLINTGFVLHCDWLLIGALCCQHLACRAKHVAGRDAQYNIRVLNEGTWRGSVPFIPVQLMKFNAIPQPWTLPARSISNSDSVKVRLCTGVCTRLYWTTAGV